MKKIINGLTYNTETATLICDISNDVGSSDFRFVDAELYITRNGRFFVAGRGGAMSIFAKGDGQGTRWGASGVIPICKDEARDYAERHASDETISAHFAAQDA